MIHYEIPGMKPFDIENLCLDYNGTIACDGKLIKGVKEKILLLKNKLNIYVLTADTYGTVEKECKKLGVNIRRFDRENAATCKKKIIKSLSGKTISFGNGLNDVKLFDNSYISVCVLEQEGVCSKLISHSTIIVKNIIDAFDLLINMNRMKATLRNWFLYRIKHYSAFIVQQISIICSHLFHSSFIWYSHVKEMKYERDV